MKTKHIFGLYGTANVGKSATLRKVFALLMAAYPTARVQTIHPGHVDFTVIIDIDGSLIGIESQGDPNSRLGESIDLFKKSGCVIIICATRTKGATVRIVEALQPEFTIIWQQKTSDQRDDAMAQTILTQVQAALGHGHVTQRTAA